MLQIMQDTHIPFMKYRRHAYIVSLSVIFLGLVGLVLRGGFNLGIDFAGGRLVEYELDRLVPIEEVRQAVEAAGLSGAGIQDAHEGGRHFLFVRLPVTDEQLADDKSPSKEIQSALEERIPGLGVELRREELVGPKVGRELRGKATLAVLIALAGILLYVGWRYEFSFGIGGIAALAHDVIITLLILTLLGRELNIPIIAALLTIGGYSINDTVVVFDRIREQAKLLQKSNPLEVVDVGVNATLSRTLITSATTLYAVAALFFLGGEVIRDFALAMLIGVAIGTYSSIYVASAVAMEINRKKAEAEAHA